MGKILVTVQELASHLSVPRDNIDKWIAAGMPVLPDGTFDLEEIKQWRDERMNIVPIKRDPMGTIEKFKINRADIYAVEQMESLRLQKIIRVEKFTKREIQDMDKKEAVALYSELRKDQREKFDQERLERGESTENVAIIVAAIKDLKKKKSNRKESIQ